MTLALDHIGKTVRGDMHLRGIDLTIEPGSFHVILGRTRAGKTSLLRILASLDRPTEGRIRWNDTDITGKGVRAGAAIRSVAMVYQQFINYPSLTVYDNIASPLRQSRQMPKKMQGDRLDARVRELAASLHIGHLLDRMPGQLSGGQQQRVAIARALAKEADLLLLDEPLVNLDYKLREELREELRQVLAARATTAIYATSDPAEALALGGHTIVLHEGRLLQHAPALDAYHRPASAEAARLLSDPPMNLFPVTITGGQAVLPGGEGSAGKRASDDHAPAGEVRIPLRGDAAGRLAHLAHLEDGAYHLGVRASDCTLRDRGNGVPVVARVELNEIGGSETFVYLRRGDDSFIVQESGVFHHELGEELTFYIDPDRLLAFEAGGAGALVASYR